jgi:type I restriction enzyme, S subunit
MAAEWQSAPLSDLTESGSPVTYGVVKPGPEVPGGVLFIRGGDIANGRILMDQLRTISLEVSGQYERTLLRGGELVVSLVGSPGQVAIVPDALHGANLARQAALVRLRRDVDARFVKYFLMSRTGQEALGAHSLGSVQQVINLRDLKTVRIPQPPLPDQRAISHILGTLDDKIELNRRMNETLEAMARAFFQSWFVDFDPVRAKAEGRDPGLPKHVADLFPDSLVQTEVGAAPDGWPVNLLGNLCRRVAMGPFGSDITTNNYVPSGVPVVRGGNLATGFVHGPFVYLTEQKADALRGANAFANDIVITHRGTLGQVGLIPEPSDFPRYVVSQSQMLLSIDKDAATAEYVFEFLRSPAGQHALLANTSQTGVPAIARPTTSTRAIRIVEPPIDVLNQFSRAVRATYARRQANVTESRALASLRDTLLPKLISGELRLKDAERFLEKAT